MSTTNCLVVDDSRLSRIMIQKFILKEHPDWNIDEKRITKANSAPALK